MWDKIKYFFEDVSLIELLITMAIVGILATIITSTIVELRSKCIKTGSRIESAPNGTPYTVYIYKCNDGEIHERLY